MQKEHILILGEMASPVEDALLAPLGPKCIWCRGVAAPPSVGCLTFVGWQEPIGCGGVAVLPDDVIVADEDGGVVIPQKLLEEVVAAAPEQERMEAWIMTEVDRGVPLPGLYPMNAEAQARYEAAKKK